jgi:hypothetical protein
MTENPAVPIMHEKTMIPKGSMRACTRKQSHSYDLAASPEAVLPSSCPSCTGIACPTCEILHRRASTSVGTSKVISEQLERKSCASVCGEKHVHHLPNGKLVLVLPPLGSRR